MQHAARTLRSVALQHRDRRIHVALSGGSTPARLFKCLAEEFRHEIPWERLQIFFGDERCVPADHPDSNYGLAHRELLARVPIPPSQVHRMPADAEDLAQAAAAYEALITQLVPAGLTGEPAFDLVWLGLGEDGHTASLFPGTRALTLRDRLVVANEVPQLTTRRMTFTYPLLNAALLVQFLVLGDNKAPVIKAVLEQRHHDGAQARAPAAGVRPTFGAVEWLLDREAAAGLAGGD